MATDADTMANRETLWRLVEMVREVIAEDGEVNSRCADGSLADIRALADDAAVGVTDID